MDNDKNSYLEKTVSMPLTTNSKSYKSVRTLSIVGIVFSLISLLISLVLFYTAIIYGSVIGDPELLQSVMQADENDIEAYSDYILSTENNSDSYIPETSLQGNTSLSDFNSVKSNQKITTIDNGLSSCVHYANDKASEGILTAIDNNNAFIGEDDNLRNNNSSVNSNRNDGSSIYGLDSSYNDTQITEMLNSAMFGISVFLFIFLIASFLNMIALIIIIVKNRRIGTQRFCFVLSICNIVFSVLSFNIINVILCSVSTYKINKLRQELLSSEN